jgi:hypothetical protein
VNDWIAVELIDRGHETLLELLFGGDTDVAQDERASLEKKPSTRLSQEPCLGVKVNSNLPAGCSASPSSGLSGNMRGMIVEDQMDRRVGRIGRVDEREELDEPRLRWRSFTRA